MSEEIHFITKHSWFGSHFNICMEVFYKTYIFNHKKITTSASGDEKIFKSNSTLLKKAFLLTGFAKLLILFLSAAAKESAAATESSAVEHKSESAAAHKCCSFHLSL